MRRTSLAAAAVTGTLILTPVAAFAAWTGSGSGTGTATATTIGPAGQPTAVQGTSAVRISWDPAHLGTGGDVDRYDVVRYAGGVSTPVCSGLKTTTCTDGSPATGQVTYGVVARIGANWRSTESTTAPFTYDGTAPTTTIDPADSTAWRSTNTVTLSASDDRSGVASISYRVDGGSASSYTAPFTLADGIHTVTYHAVDNAGNVEADKTAHLSIDTVKPTASVNPVAGSVADSVTITGHDERSGVARVEYLLDGSTTWKTGTSVSWASGSGSHTVTYRAVDNAGNVGASVTARYTATVTVPAPQVTCGASTKNSITITWSAVSGAQSYDLYFPSKTTPLNVTATTFTIVPNNSTGSGTFSVRAHVGADVSGPSNIVTYDLPGGTCQ
ncbi:MAG: OmpL47-type beta-barrel domain-containing protein [Marmoricola sp.]